MPRLSLPIVLAGTLLTTIAAAQDRVPKVELGPNASLGGARLLPDDSPWHKDISKEPVDRNSARILARIGMGKTLRADFGTVWEGAPIGIPYIVIPKTQPKVPVAFTEAADESDPGPYPIPPNAPIEGGPKGTGDRHVLVLDRDAWQLCELFNAYPDGKGGWKAGSGALWDLKKNQVRPAGWTSADAAGLPILPGLVRYDEAVGRKAIEHALRFTVSKTRRAYVPPASHWASDGYDDDLPPMGMRVRLKAELRHLRLRARSQGHPAGAQDLRHDPGRQRQRHLHQRRSRSALEQRHAPTDHADQGQ